MAEVQVGYDELADVLYVSLSDPDRHARSGSDEHGLVWRKLPNGRFVGLTVQNFRRRWAGRMDELQRIILARMPEVANEEVAELA